MTTSSAVGLDWTREELAERIRIVDAALGETRVEAHRTHSVEYREKVLGHEELLRRLLKILQSAQGS